MQNCSEFRWMARIAGVLLLCAICGRGFAQDQDAVKQRLRAGRDAQDVPAIAAAVRLAAGGKDGRHPYLRALAASYTAEVYLEQGQKDKAAEVARRGIESAREAVGVDARNAEYRRLLGTLCGQMIPANLLSALEFGRCAKEEIDKALELNPRSAAAYLARGVGNYYLPEAFGGGVEKAIADMRRAVALDAKLADGWLWLGIALRKKRDFAGAHEALAQARALAPQRKWVDEQIRKTPMAGAKP